MPTRRRFLQHTTGVAALAALGPLLPNLSWAADSSGLLRRRIPSSGELLPVIGLGTSRTHDVPLDEAHLAPLREVMATLIGGGASLVDTAPSYGRAEAVCGALATGARDRLFLASKVSSSGREAGLRQIETSFADLGTERIDLLQVHNLQDTETQLKLLRELKEQGKVRYIGVTHYLDAAHERLLEVLRREPLDFVQFNYSIGERNAERELLPFCADKGIAVLINRPFQRAALFDKVRGKDLPEWAGAELDAGSWAQLMLKYILANPAVTAVIPATSKARYMADNLQAGHGRLPDAAQRRRIVELFA
ncbi:MULTISPECIES: aldo/keto reductase [unclassified Pseudomonas]|uniref:aldo/keto reductase n=1 Tax=unclassified Pseudomonas TaxID=196821 RepID=UPI00244A7244|nr:MULTISPECIES: aldo/keto reductase [unclassified Pseudomonas]MDH0896014.1 aldo/keto reductase [Pseudomonas sp. GD03875]MDH1065947.1 aldo/keto reductase [Pseudomonas sp. GD03985]